MVRHMDAHSSSSSPLNGIGSGPDRLRVPGHSKAQLLDAAFPAEIVVRTCLALCRTGKTSKSIVTYFPFILKYIILLYFPVDILFILEVPDFVIYYTNIIVCAEMMSSQFIRASATSFQLIG